MLSRALPRGRRTLRGTWLSQRVRQRNIENARGANSNHPTRTMRVSSMSASGCLHKPRLLRLADSRTLSHLPLLMEETLYP
jgi:hypothetical protein